MYVPCQAHPLPVVVHKSQERLNVVWILRLIPFIQLVNLLYLRLSAFPFRLHPQRMISSWLNCPLVNLSSKPSFAAASSTRLTCFYMLFKGPAADVEIVHERNTNLLSCLGVYDRPNGSSNITLHLRWSRRGSERHPQHLVQSRFCTHGQRSTCSLVDQELGVTPKLYRCDDPSHRHV